MSSVIRPYLPHLLVGVLIGLVMVGAYAAVGLASINTPKSLWSISPLTINFSGSGGPSSSGSAGDSFKCAPSVTDVTLRTSVSSPVKIKPDAESDELRVLRSFIQQRHFDRAMSCRCFQLQRSVHGDCNDSPTVCLSNYCSGPFRYNNRNLVVRNYS